MNASIHRCTRCKQPIYLPTVAVALTVAPPVELEAEKPRRPSLAERLRQTFQEVSRDFQGHTDVESEDEARALLYAMNELAAKVAAEEREPGASDEPSALDGVKNCHHCGMRNVPRVIVVDLSDLPAPSLHAASVPPPPPRGAPIPVPVSA